MTRAVDDASTGVLAPAPADASVRRGERRSLRSRFRAWVSGRVPPADTLALTHRNVYILPTRAGLLFAATLAVLLLASINYQLNLGYVLTFLLAGSGAVSMHITHRTLRGLTLHLKPLQPAHATEAVAVGMVLTSPSHARHGIGLRMDTHDDAGTAWVDAPADAQATANATWVPQHRGWQALPPVIVETRFPLGLFRAWAVWRPKSKLLVYPQVETPAAPLPSAQPTPGGSATQRTLATGTDLQGVRAYRRGDPLNRVVWRKAAKTFEGGGELVTRDLTTPARWQLWLDWNDSGNLGAEQRLSRLAAWVLACEREGADYGLRLPRRELALAHGPAHRRDCLEALATWS